MSLLTQLKAGDSLPDIALPPVSRLDLIKYAGASGDFNPIHTIDEAAEKAGLPGIIAHGMWTMGNLAKLFTPCIEYGFIQEMSVRFAGMVFLDDVITLKAAVEENMDHRWIFQIAAVNQNGKDVLKGKAVIFMYD